MADEKLKKRIQRCLSILTTVLSRKGVNRTVLAEEFGCSVRTIAEDIALLREIGFGIRYEQGEYALSTADLKIPPLPLNEEQILALFIASQLLLLTPLEQKAEQALHNMFSALTDEAIAFLRNLTNRVFIAPGGDLGDTNILFNVYRAVSECRSIHIRYQAFSTQQDEEHDVDPYGIYIKDRARSYMVGYSYGKCQQIRRFKLCRIQELSFRGLTFTYPPNFSIQEEMQTGLWSGEQEQEVLIRFRPEVAQLVREREPAEYIEPLPGGYLHVRKMVRHLNEVFYDLLRYGRHAEVLEPEALRDRIKTELQAWGKVYEEVIE